MNAVERAPTPQNVSELKSFLGMVQYYHSFLPWLATTLKPLHRLLQKKMLIGNGPGIARRLLSLVRRV